MGTSDRDELLEQARIAALGTLCGGVAHELANPLSYVLTNLRFLLEQLPSLVSGRAPASDVAEAEQSIADALEGALRIDALVATLRAFASADVEPHRYVDLKLAIAHATAIARTELRRHARVVVQCEGSPQAWASAVSVLQVLLGLILHACRAMSSSDAAGEPETARELRIHCCAKEGGVELSILFDAPESSVVSEVGSADNLAICRGVVESQGGVFRVARQDQKTLFFVSLPEHARPERDSLPPKAA